MADSLLELAWGVVGFVGMDEIVKCTRTKHQGKQHSSKPKQV